MDGRERLASVATKATEKEKPDDDHIEERNNSYSEDVDQAEPKWQLEFLGLEQQTQRYVSTFETIALGFNICNSWVGVGAVLLLVVAEGGSVTLLYGVILMLVVYFCIVSTMAELASVYPTAGGQYHWTNILAPASCRRALSYACGMINVFSWIAISAGICIILPQVLVGMALFYNPTTYVPQPWHSFLIYQAFNFICAALNIFTMRNSMWMYRFGYILTLTTFIVIVITCVARAETYQPNEAVWKQFTNASGWSSQGLVFFIGLVACNYMYTGIDGAIHIAEECTNAASAVPKALYATWVAGFVTTFPFAIAMIYTVQDWDGIVNSVTGFPIYDLWVQATRSDRAATTFVAVLLLIGIIATVACYQTASRLTWSLARDNALVFSSYLGHMHPKLEAPVWAIIFNTVIIFIIGCIYLGSSTAFQAFIGTGIILNMMTFIFPAALIMYRGRGEKWLPSKRFVKLPGPLMWVCNVMTVVFPIIGSVFYCFPTFYPVTSGNMNYASAVIGCMGIFALLNWFVWTRKHYKGPTLQGS